jgi:hypothetical protein
MAQCVSLLSVAQHYSTLRPSGFAFQHFSFLVPVRRHAQAANHSLMFRFFDQSISSPSVAKLTC